MVTIYIDGKQYIVKKSDNLLKSCLSLNLDIPYFCWHSELGSIGVCRQCAVKKYKNFEDKTGQLVMSCMTPSTEGTIISINDDESKFFRKSILELMMINHPHDCPICEEGGHCHLQDVTVMTGHHNRRYRFNKRIYVNQYLGPFISHQMNRCIVCYRCTRYYNDYADGKDFGVYGSHDDIYFGRFNSGILESEFAGNLVEICPTGVFTDKTYSKNYARKWDLQSAPSICNQCSIGCNILIEERDGQIRRIENRYHGKINRYFLCDRGRFGYDYINNMDTSLEKPFKIIDNTYYYIDSIEETIEYAKKILSNAKNVVGIGSSRASLENNFALKELVGENNFCTGFSKLEQECIILILNILKNSGIYTPSLYEIEDYDAILILGEDITQTASRMALSVRQAVKKHKININNKNNIPYWHSAALMNINLNNIKYPLFITSVDKTKLDDISALNYYSHIDNQARLAFAIANILDNSAPIVKNLDSNIIKNYANIIANFLSTAKKPLIICGSNEGNKSIISAAANVAKSLKKYTKEVGISFVLPDANSLGLGMIGGKDIDNTLSDIMNYKYDSMIILENDIYRHAIKENIDNMLKIIKYIIVLDYQKSLIQEKSHLVIPSSNIADSSGTLINQEVRAQRFFKVRDLTNKKDNLIIDSWRWLHNLYVSLYSNKTILWNTLDDVISNLADKIPDLYKIKKASNDSSFRVYNQKIARKSHRYSGHTALHAHINIHESSISYDKDTFLSFAMEIKNTTILPNYSNIALIWSPGWNSIQVWNKYQNYIGENLRYGNPGIKLIDINNNNVLHWYNNIPDKFSSKKNIWHISPYWHLFGSEELSQKSIYIKEIMPKPYIIISEKEANILNIIENTRVTFYCNKQLFCLPAKFSRNLVPGQIGLPLGFVGFPPILAGLYIKDLQKAIL